MVSGDDFRIILSHRNPSIDILDEVVDKFLTTVLTFFFQNVQVSHCEVDTREGCFSS
jgi:hypothetical protein